MSPNSLEKQKAELKYHRKFKKVFDTLIDRVDKSSSGNNSGDERHRTVVSTKKRKFNEFFEMNKTSNL